VRVALAIVIAACGRAPSHPQPRIQDAAPLDAAPDARPPEVACDPRDVDPTNPRCAGVKPCDANHPEFANPSCCAVACLDRGCVVKLAPIPGERDEVWLELGAKQGFNNAYEGRVYVHGVDGDQLDMPLLIKQVERERSRIVLVHPKIDPTKLDRGWAKVLPPHACSRR
jgi:hypothetical protein